MQAILCAIENAQFRSIDLARRPESEHRKGAAARAHVAVRLRPACPELAHLHRSTLPHATFQSCHIPAVQRTIANADDHRAPTQCSATHITTLKRTIAYRISTDSYRRRVGLGEGRRDPEGFAISAVDLRKSMIVCWTCTETIRQC